MLLLVWKAPFYFWYGDVSAFRCPICFRKRESDPSHESISLKNKSCSYENVIQKELKIINLTLRLGNNAWEVLNNHSYMLNAANFWSSYWFDIDGFWHRKGAVILVLVFMLLSLSPKLKKKKLVLSILGSCQKMG